MSYHLNNPMHVPPGGYRYVQPETGEVFDGQCLSGTVDLVGRHRQTMSLARPSPDEIRADVEDQICMRVGHEWCSHMKAGSWGFRVDWDTIQAGTRALMAWALAAVKGENPYVDQAEANRRAAICSKCWANHSIGGCAGCGMADRIRDLLTDAKGDRRTPLDERLGHCLVCGCSNAAQIWIRPDLLDGAMSDHQRACYGEIPNCWKSKLAS